MTTATATKVETYALKASNGRHIRMATRVIMADGRVIKFIDKMGKAEAIRQAEMVVAREAK
jgi:hypothetical protein